MIGTMNPDEIEAMLQRLRVGRIGCSLHDRPYVVPIDYTYSGGCVYGYGAPGRKIEIMRTQPNVCFQVDEIEGPSSWRTVIADGVYEELTDPAERRDALARLVRRSGGLVQRVPNPGTQIVVFRLRLTDRSGRFSHADA
jgi:nitroimidazol reductase NimA-like FMN-containing flavoprotein (pyridoxamine 5'-phosphate oxidase superfamily)